MDLSQSVAHLLLRTDEDLDVVRTRQPSNGLSSGFQSGTGPTGTPGSPSSPVTSVASSPRSNYHNGACSLGLAGGNDRPTIVDDENKVTSSVLHTPFDRHSVPLETTPSSSKGERRQTIPGDRVFDQRHRISHHTEAKKFTARTRHNHGCGVTADGLPTRSVHHTTGNTNPTPSSLETILQGQELSFYSALGPHGEAPRLTANVPPTHTPTGLDNWHGTGWTAGNPAGLRHDWPQTAAAGAAAAVTPCCACRAVATAAVAGAAAAGDQSCDSPGHCEQFTAPGSNSMSYLAKNTPIYTPRSVTTCKSDLRAQSGPQWAKELIGRFRIAPNSNHSADHVPGQSLDQRYAQSPLPSQPLGRSSHDRVRPAAAAAATEAMDCSPDSIDPRRLPRTSGPTSGCLEFAKTPRHQLSSAAPSSSNPIPVGSGRKSLATGSPSGTPSSWKSRKRAMKTRWFSQSNSVTTDNFSGSCSSHARLSYSAVEEFQGAVDLLANRQQTTNLPTGMPPVRTSVRVKRASESDRFLVISKSPSDSREEIFPCTLEHFDEHHMYNTLFRYSTCYDVLPDSGKLVILDSRLGIIRAIRALLENGVPAAPIWHSATQRVAGLFSQDLALHLLTSLLCYSGGLEEDGFSIPQPLEQQTQFSSSARPASSIADGLRHWGVQHLQDVLRLFNSDPDKSRYAPSSFDSALIVSPQTQLKRALCHLIHSSHHHHHTERHHHWSPPDGGSVEDASRSMGSGSSSGDWRANHAPRIPIPKPVRQLSDPGSRRRATPVIPLPSPTHLVVMNPSCGNVLGVLGVDRLLAYLRLRLNELPYSHQMLSTIGSTAGLRWTERQRLLKHHFAASSRGQLTSLDADECVFPLPASSTAPSEPPVLRPTTLCREALCTLTQWLPQLPALPVLASTDGATAIPNQSGLIGLIAPGDLLHFFLDNCPDTAANQPVSKILEVKLSHCPFLHECVCYTYETLVDVLDRMFRLRTPCLVLFDTIHVRSMPVGMVTAKDLLCAIMETRPNGNHHHHHSRHHSGQSHDRSRRPSQNSDIPIESPMELFEDDLDMAPVEKIQPTPDSAGSFSGNLPFEPSSDDSASSDSTCSAQSGPEHSAPVETTSSQRLCRCACHRTAAAAYVDPASQHAPSPLAVAVTFQASPSTHSPSVRFAFPSVSAPIRPALPNQPPAVPPPTGNGRRGDDVDDALFPMD